MFGHDFYHAQIRKAIVVFGTLFNDITISRVSEDGTEAQRLKVPISYGPREKWMARTTEDPTAARAYALTLPRIAFQCTGIRYDGPRKLPTTLRIASTANSGSQILYDHVYAPVPYTLDFQVSVLSDSAEDGSRIIEQILPFFAPDWTVTMKILDEMPEVATDVPIVLNSCTSRDEYEADFTRRRTVVWELLFSMRFQVYGPVTEKKIIKIATVNFYANTDSDANTIATSVEIRPGLTANGEPTSNIAETIPYTDIDEDDNYGYIITYTDFPDA